MLLQIIPVQPVLSSSTSLFVWLQNSPIIWFVPLPTKFFNGSSWPTFMEILSSFELTNNVLQTLKAAASSLSVWVCQV